MTMPAHQAPCKAPRHIGLAALLLVHLALAGCAAPAVDFTILHTNDHHGRFWRSASGEQGLAARATLVKAVRDEVAARGGHLLLLDAGDVNTGTPESDLLEAEPDFRGMSTLRYDAMAVGNHEFDRSAATQSRQRNEWSRFAWLSANVTRNGTPVFEPFKQVQWGPLRVAILGLTTEDTLLMGVAGRYPQLQFEPAQAAAGRWVPELRRQADVVIALTHLGHYVDGRHGSAAPGDVELARAVPGIDIIVGGHSHHLVCMRSEAVRQDTYEPQAPCQPDRQNGTWIVQAGEQGRFVGRADFRWQAGRLTLLRYRLLPVNLQGTPAWAEDVDMLALLQPFRDRTDTAMAAVVVHSRGLFDGERARVRHRPSALGQLVGAAMREATQADVALLQGGGLRASLPPGAVTLRELLSVLPFRNTLVTVRMPGTELARYLDTALRFTPGTGAYPQIAGAQPVREDAGPGRWRVAGRPLDEQAVYTLVLPSFVAHGGDGYADLRGHPGYADTGLVDSDVLRAYLEGRRVVDPAAFAPPPAGVAAP